MTTMTQTQAGITCGHCSTFGAKVKHDTIAAVRECASLSKRGTVTQTQSLVPTTNPYVLANRADRERKTVTQTQSHVASNHVPAARYAIGPADDTRFYRVDRPTEGRWAGFVFVKVQAGDDLHPIKNPTEHNRVLAEIGRDVEGALLRYGREIGACGHCGRTLTNPESRDAGIGPVCRAKWAA